MGIKIMSFAYCPLCCSGHKTSEANMFVSAASEALSLSPIVSENTRNSSLYSRVDS